MRALFPAKEIHSKLEAEAAAYAETGKLITSRCEQLHALRSSGSPAAVKRAEDLVNRLANTPKDFATEFATYHAQFQKFDSNLEAFRADYDAAVAKSAVGATLGATAGAATILGGPAAAMAVATTFGTASTGTAISALSGAAATNAALAWLGGGAVAAGGSGVAGGTAFLALAGPVGWALAGTAIVGGAGWAVYKSHASAKEAAEKLEQVSALHSKARTTEAAIRELQDTTFKHLAELNRLTSVLEGRLPTAYADCTQAQKEMLGALVNNVRALGELLLKAPESENHSNAQRPVTSDAGFVVGGNGIVIDNRGPRPTLEPVILKKR